MSAFADLIYNTSTVGWGSYLGSKISETLTGKESTVTSFAPTAQTALNAILLIAVGVLGYKLIMK